MKTFKSIDSFYDDLPDVFDLKNPPFTENDDWIFVDSDDIENDLIDLFNHIISGITLAPINSINDLFVEPPNNLLDKKKPGSPVSLPKGEFCPPPDAFAFYLPFHEYYPNYWGIYILLEGIIYIAREIYKKIRNSYPGTDRSLYQLLIEISKRFLFYHEAFHSSVESFATKLELSHRKKIYVDAFYSYYLKHYGTDDCLEEALATVNSYEKIRKYLKDQNTDKTHAENIKSALFQLIETMPPGYNRAAQIIVQMNKDYYIRQFKSDLCKHTFNFKSNNNSWQLFTYAFDPLVDINDIVYLVNRKSLISKIILKNVKLIKTRDLIDKLKKLVGLQLYRHGKGSHQIWIANNGKKIPIPHHTSDLSIGLVKKILKELDINISYEKFLSI